MNTCILKIISGIIGYFAFSNYLVHAQEPSIDEFLEWPPTDNYNFVIIAIIILIAIGVLANYLWSNRRGRRYSQE